MRLKRNVTRKVRVCLPKTTGTAPRIHHQNQSAPTIGDCFTSSERKQKKICGGGAKKRKEDKQATNCRGSSKSCRIRLVPNDKGRFLRIRGCNHSRKINTLARKVKQERSDVPFLQETKCSFISNGEAWVENLERK